MKFAEVDGSLKNIISHIFLEFYPNDQVYLSSSYYRMQHPFLPLSKTNYDIAIPVLGPIFLPSNEPHAVRLELLYITASFSLAFK